MSEIKTGGQDGCSMDTSEDTSVTVDLSVSDIDQVDTEITDKALSVAEAIELPTDVPSSNISPEKIKNTSNSPILRQTLERGSPTKRPADTPIIKGLLSQGTSPDKRSAPNPPLLFAQCPVLKGILETSSPYTYPENPSISSEFEPPLKASTPNEETTTLPSKPMSSKAVETLPSKFDLNKDMDAPTITPTEDMKFVKITPSKDLEAVKFSPNKDVEALNSTQTMGLEVPKASPTKSMESPKASPIKFIEAPKSTPTKDIEDLKSTLPKDMKTLKSTKTMDMEDLKSTPTKYMEALSLHSPPHKDMDGTKSLAPTKQMESLNLVDISSVKNLKGSQKEVVPGAGLDSEVKISTPSRSRKIRTTVTESPYNTRLQAKRRSGSEDKAKVEVEGKEKASKET